MEDGQVDIGHHEGGDGDKEEDGQELRALCVDLGGHPQQGDGGEEAGWGKVVAYSHCSALLTPTTLLPLLPTKEKVTGMKCIFLPPSSVSSGLEVTV